MGGTQNFIDDKYRKKCHSIKHIAVLVLQKLSTISVSLFWFTASLDKVFFR